MKLIWTKSNLPLSLLIRAVTGEDCSHFAFVFESQAKGLMFESNLLGTHPRFLETEFKSRWRFTIVHQRDIPMTPEMEDAIWDRVVSRFDGKGYDYGGAIYLGWWKLLNRLFGVALPKTNKWASDDLYFCDEVYIALKGVPGVPQSNVGTGMETPHDLWKEIGNANSSGAE